ncbi:MAG: carboxypeptidase-like regulatory domain-containing protein [Acidobacteriota bacterium]|nr:carboxypeptidase-like regulatory domain-containing protein [Acidobacteriota bacterium]
MSLQRVVVLALSTSGRVQGTKSVEGGFQIEVMPGKYILSAANEKSGKISKPLTIDLREKDITGLEIDLTSGYEIRGRVVVDGQESLDFSKIDIGFGMHPAKISADGTFHTHLFQGKVHYLVQGLPADWYVKQVLVAGKPITGRRFNIEPGSTDVIFTLSPRGGRLAITLEGAASGFPVAYVAILPDRGEIADVESMPHAQADASGRFIVRGVPPGSYRVFTLDLSNWNLMMRPDALLEKYRKLAPLINVADGEQKQIVIPVAPIQPQ